MSENEPFCNYLSKAKKLVSASIISSLVIKISKEDNMALQRVMCVSHLIWFKKKEVQALINSGSEVNVITPAYTLKLGF